MIQQQTSDFCGANLRDWSKLERFWNQVVLGIASRTYYVGLFSVQIVALVLDCLEWIAVNLYIRTPIKAHDEKPQSEGWTVMKMRYGDHPREYLFHLKPKETPSERRTIIYVHGGGFVAANAGVLMPNLTAFCRKGFDIYCVNYSHDPFPAGIISMMKVLDFVRMNQELTEVVLLGDSAGGNLVIQAAACAMNPPLFAHVLKITKNASLSEMHFPRIQLVASVCGLLDRTAISEMRLTTIYYLENLFMLLMVKFSVWMYESQTHSRDLEY